MTTWAVSRNWCMISMVPCRCVYSKGQPGGFFAKKVLRIAFPQNFYFHLKIFISFLDFYFLPNQKKCSSQKLQRIECCYPTSIWKCFDQHYIGDSMEMCNLVLQFPLIPQWNAEQDISRSVPVSNLQLVVTFDSINFF